MPMVDEFLAASVPAPGPHVQTFAEPLIRTVGRDLPPDYLHGTKKRNLRTLAEALRPDGAGKAATGTIIDHMFGIEQNEFGAELYLSEFRQAHQAVQFAAGRGNALAVVRLRTGTRLLDLADEAARAPMMAFGSEPQVLRFFSRPAITDGFVRWQCGRVHPGYKERHPDWRERVAGRLDPASASFDVRSWQEDLLPYIEHQGWSGVRFADEILLADRTVIEAVRPATRKERATAALARAWPGASRNSLYVDHPIGARHEASTQQAGPGPARAISGAHRAPHPVTSGGLE